MRAAAAGKLWNNREIHHCSRHMVEIIGEDVQRRASNDFRKVAITETMFAQASRVRITDITPEAVAAILRSRA
jgi:hypothetical protein